MAFWDKIFAKEKKEKPDGQAADLTSKSDATADKTESLQAAVRTEEAQEKRGKDTGVLASPHMTEKTTDAMNKGAYVFRVARTANKQTVAAAVAGRYGVQVDRVRMMIQPAKERRRGRQIGWKHGFKKAVVQLKEGQRIETL